MKREIEEIPCANYWYTTLDYGVVVKRDASGNHWINTAGTTVTFPDASFLFRLSPAALYRLP